MYQEGQSLAQGSCALLQVAMSAEQFQEMRWMREIEERNKELTDEELDSMLPGADGES